MPKPIKRHEFLRRLRLAGWEGLHQKGPHPYMEKAGRRLTVPNPHGGELDWTLVKRILRVAEISPEQWEDLGRM